MKLSPYTVSLLNDIERRIDPETEEDFAAQWQTFWDGKSDTNIFSPKRKKCSPGGVELKPISVNEALHDPELMLDSQLADLSNRLNSPGSALGLRANYGTGILTSVLGADIFEMPPEMNTLPTTRSLNDSDAVRKTVDGRMPDLYTGFGKDVLFFGEMCMEIFEKYPKIKKYVQIYHPDTQGPLDLAELFWGGEMLCEMYENPDLVHALLRLITDTYIAFLEKWYAIVPRVKGLTVHWEILQRGTVMLRLDSGMNISGAFYDEFSKPYDREVLDHFGGGCIHFCGRGSHYIESLCEMEKVYGFNLSQPELNDMETIFRTAEKRDKRIISLPRAEQFVRQLGIGKSIVHA